MSDDGNAAFTAAMQAGVAALDEGDAPAAAEHFGAALAIRTTPRSRRIVC